MYFGAFTLTNAIMTQVVPVIKFILRYSADNVAIYVFLYKNNKSKYRFLFYFTVAENTQNSNNFFETLCFCLISHTAQICNGLSIQNLKIYG